MAFRFRKSFKIAPGIKINIGKNGFSSIGLGPRGASISVGKQGTYSNVGIPGTGISFRNKINGNDRVTKREEQRLIKLQEQLEKAERREEALSKVSLSLNENGSINILNAFKEPLSRSDLKLVWDQQGNTIYEWLENQAEEINGDVELLEDIYKDTPEPSALPKYSAQVFALEKPKKPELKNKPTEKILPSLGFFANFFKSKRLEHEEKQKELNIKYREELSIWGKREEEAFKQYEKELEEWKNNKKKFDEQQVEYEENFEILIDTDINFMEMCLENVFNQLVWPRETLISYDIKDDGETIWIDIDLPEIEDLPQKVATISSTGKKLNIKNKAKKQLQLEYAKHIHGISFRLIGTVFATLPKAQNIIISGYSQRLDSSTGKINDDYLYSFKINRNKSNEIDFNSLDLLDPIEALNVFEHKKKMTATGIFKPIAPFEN